MHGKKKGSFAQRYNALSSSQKKEVAKEFGKLLLKRGLLSEESMAKPKDNVSGEHLMRARLAV